MPSMPTAVRPGAGTIDLRDHAEAVVQAATRAPSYRNIQPWSFRVTAHQVEVYADRARRCPVADPDDRQLFLGLGAAVFGIRLALGRLGLRPVVGLSRDRRRPDLAAVVVAAGPGGLLAEDQRLYDQLVRRRTVWTQFLAGPVPVPLEVRLTDAARREAVQARWLVRPGERRAVLNLARRTASAQDTDVELQQETVHWPTAARTVPEPPSLLLLCTPTDHRADWLRAGQALHHLLLAATEAGHAASFLSAPLEVGWARDRLRSDLDLTGVPQVLLGLGRSAGPPPPATLRRSPAEVLRHDDGRPR